MEKNYQQLVDQFPGMLKQQEPLWAYTTFKVGGPADLFCSVSALDDLIRLVKACQILRIPYFILGGGSNVLVSDDGFRGLVIKNNCMGITIKGMKGLMKGSDKKSIVFLEVDAGVPMNRLVRFTLEEGLGGLEMHLGLPGSVGGAVYMNSKWMKPEGFVGDAIHQATILTQKGEIKDVDREYFRFSYGTSSIQQTKDTLLRMVFALTVEDKDVLWQRANESVEHRNKTQPQGVHTAGCVFKNISKGEAIEKMIPDGTTSAGYLLDKAGCKGLRVGGAEISPIHANFIVTQKGATAKDVVELINLMKAKVQKTFGVTLQEEVLLVGQF